jgi:uncharacterized C2H2 Zn-finger protein
MIRGDTFIGGVTTGRDEFICEVCGYKYWASFIREFGVPDYENVRCPNCQILGRGKSKEERKRDKEWDELFEKIIPTIKKLKERNK